MFLLIKSRAGRHTLRAMESTAFIKAAISSLVLKAETLARTVPRLIVPTVQWASGAQWRPARTAKPAPAAYPDVEKALSEKFGTKVLIKGGKKGKIEIEYYSEADLTRIVDLL